MERWEFEVIQVKDPWNFVSRRKHDNDMPSDFKEMTDSMTDYLNTALGRGEPVYRPIIGETCAAHHRDGTWHRVCVESVYTADYGRKLKCYLIDKGTHQNINPNRFHKLPTKFKDFPAQVYKCHLSGVQPLSMGFDETETGLGVQHRPSKKWDSASVNFMTEMIQECSGCRGEIVKQEKDNILHLRLHVKIGPEWRCLNDELVQLKYAVYINGVSNQYKSVSSKEAFSFNSDSSEETSALSFRVNDPEKPSLSPFSDSDSEKLKKQRLYIQNNLKNASLLSPNKDNQSGDGDEKNVPKKNFANTATQSKIREPSKSPCQARGRASLQQVLRTVRPGGLSSSSQSPEKTSPAISKSALSNLKQPSSPQTNSIHPTVRFSDVDETHYLSPKSTLSSPPSSSLLTSSSYQDKDRVMNSSKENRLSPKRVIDFDSQEDYFGKGAKPKTKTTDDDKNSKPTTFAVSKNRQNVSSKEWHLGKMEGQRLLTQLRLKSGLGLIDTESALPKTLRPDKPEMYPSLGTLAYGKPLPMALYNVMDIPFVPPVKKILTKELEKEMAQGIEAYVWPAVLAGRNVVGISQPNLDNEMAYIPPLLSLISDRKDYMSLPQKMGPLILVIAPSWKRTKQVYDLVEQFSSNSTYENRQIRSIALYAGGTEECAKTESALIRGCEILISTPSSLLRSVTSGITSLKRVCHVVLDDADLLSRHFKDEIHDIMQLFISVVKDRQDITVPRQVLIFAKQWNDDVDHLRLHFTKEPVLSFSSRLEASVYGGVKQVVMMCRSQQRLANLSKLVDSMSNSCQKVIAWTSDIEEAKELAKTINSRGVYCLLAHHGMESDNVVEEVRQRWFHASQLSNKLIVLVATDQCYQDLALTDATAVIHYDIPSRTRFGNRLACMIQYFSDRLTGIKSELEPVSHVILTEVYPTHARSLFNVLKRCKSNYPPALQDFIKGYQMGLQTQHGTDLCPFLKSFGFCLHEDRCEKRHVLVPEKDLKTGETTHDTLPVSGEVKLKAIRVVSANHFYCRLLDHRSPDNCHTSLKEDFQDLTMKLSLFFSKDINHLPYLPPKDLSNVSLCGFKKDGVVYRAKVVEMKDGTRAAPMKQCKVWLVDFGHFKYGTVDQLVKLPPDLIKVAYQAVEVFVCRIKPMDNEAEWTDRADIFVNELVEDKVLIGRIVLRLGMSMWLDPLVHQVKLKDIGLANDLVIRQEILTQKFATTNPDHIQLLCELCRGKVEIPETVMQQYFDYCLEIELTQDTLPSDGEFHLVNVTAVFSPGLFYIQKWETIKELDELEALISQQMSSDERREDARKKCDSAVSLGSGSVCLAKSSDGKWSRAKILSETEDSEWSVFFLDYGDRELIPKHLVEPLPRDFAQLPCQAIECQMADIKCPGDDWSSDTVGVICDLSLYVYGDKKQLTARVASKTDSSYCISQRLVVDLYGLNNVRFAEELVWLHMAVCVDENDNIKPVLDKPALKNQLFFNPWDKVPYLCANIYWAKDSVQSCALAKELKALLSQRTEGWDSSMIERDLIPPLVQVIGYISDPEANGFVLESLISCCEDSQKFCEVAIEENLALSLSISLEKVSKSEIQLQAAKAVASLLSRPCFLESAKAIGMESIFMDFLESHSQSPLDLKLLSYICKALCLYIEQDDQSSFLQKNKEALLDHVLTWLTVEDRHGETKGPWLYLLSTLSSAQDDSLQRKIMRESTIRLLIQLTKSLQNPECVHYLLLIFQALINTNRKYKIDLLEWGLQPVLRLIYNDSQSKQESALCQKLLSSLNLQFPAQESLSGRRVEEEYKRKICNPPVAWTQTCFKVQLKVKVKNAAVEDFEISSNKLKCCILSEGTQFELDWELYCNVVPGKSRIEPYSSHTVISLHKEKEEKWGRLLKQKNKPPNLSPDFDNLLISDEEEEIGDENEKGLTKKRKGIFEGLPAIHATRLYSSDESDSDDMAIYSNSDDDEPRIDYESVIRNCMSFDKSLKKH